MFERFTEDARAVVVGAVAHAERTEAGKVEEQHLLLALLDRRADRASFALDALGLGEDGRKSVARALSEARRRGGLSRADADALSGLGIDLSEIVARVEEAHGAGALTGARTAGRGGRSRWPGLGTGHRPFARGAKDVLTGALRNALAHHDRHIGAEHLLLSLAARPGVPAEALADHGVTYEGVRRVLYGGGRAEAG
ncbi:Clp protease N-terminal domain-containing protein [Streptomyces minutiscleroticus]|uniref:Peptidase n=1 Tax=Streptomyces minutiscleroticus TaxID=68238 RepID=A0A918U6L6_9ACTN|nr:Clp protease N-terminal domain-containing protein [Streptomyces minutiscleroticus]GGY00325.1 peptidase [Streptomyces minutiscleroticus]